MKIYDISQEVLSCKVYKGDVGPKAWKASSMDEGAVYNLTEFSMGAHNGTHVDAPKHFFNDGKSVEGLSLHRLVGDCFVCVANGDIGKEEVVNILENAKKSQGVNLIERILIKGTGVINPEGAKEFVKQGILLIGSESQSVGPENAPMEVHKILLEKEIVLLEGIRLNKVEEGKYLLCAAPLNIKDADGSPCRAILIEN